MIGPGADFIPQDTVDAARKSSPSKDDFYLESISPESADKIIVYGFDFHTRVEIQDTSIRIYIGEKINGAGYPDSARAFLTPREKEALDSAMTDLPAGTYYNTRLIDCSSPDISISAYGIKRIQFAACTQMDIAPGNPLGDLIRLLRLACLRQGIPDVTKRR